MKYIEMFGSFMEPLNLQLSRSTDR